MLIPSAMFANAAGNDNGLLTVHGGGWVGFNIAVFPGTVHGVVAGLLDLEPGHRPTTIEAAVTGPDRVTQVFAAQVVEDASSDNIGSRVPLIVPMAFVAREPGLYVVSITDPEGPLTSLDLEVRLFVPPAPAP